MSNFKFSLLLIFMPNLITIIVCQLDERKKAKALACMTIIDKNIQGKIEKSIHSSMALKCYMTISEIKAELILKAEKSGQNNILSKKDFEQLTNYNSLRFISQSELIRKSSELEKALNYFKDLQRQAIVQKGGNIDPSDYDEYNDDDDDDDENYNIKISSIINYFGLIYKRLSNIFNLDINMYIIYFVFVISVYSYFVFLMIMNKRKKRSKKRENTYKEEK